MKSLPHQQVGLLVRISTLNLKTDGYAKLRGILYHLQTLIYLFYLQMAFFECLISLKILKNRSKRMYFQKLKSYCWIRFYVTRTMGDHLQTKASTSFGPNLEEYEAVSFSIGKYLDSTCGWSCCTVYALLASGKYSVENMFLTR